MKVDHSRDGESRAPLILAILSVGCALSTIVVGLRSYTRLVLVRAFGLDDAVIAAAQILTIASAVAGGLESKYGLGSHTWVQPKDYFIPYMKAFYSSIVIYNISMCLIKISIILQYRRIFTVPMMQVITLCCILFLAAWAITVSFLLTLICVPVAKFWDNSIPGRCLDSLTVWYVIAGFNLTTDFATFAMPLPVIRSLQLPMRHKILLAAVFSLGLFTCIISIIRLRTLKIAASTDDPNWDNVDAMVWSFVEVAIAIIAACLPTLRPLLAKLAPRVFGTSRSRSEGRPPYGSYIHAPESSLNTNPNNSRPGDISAGILRRDSIELAAHDSKTTSLSGGYSISVTSGKVLGRTLKGEWSRRSAQEDEEPVWAKGGI
ncbi:hypothetical protein BGZ63DRAFT_425160 [Mariannaea sp. PMI_226]|nr:hypothetical protein BGZ63DRAFT_425160 [Mariannaea sp. PMI_226]